MNLRAYRADALMILTALIWGSTFIAQTLGMDHIGPFLYTGLRFLLGALAILPLVLLTKPQGQVPLDGAGGFGRSMLGGSVLLGLVLTIGINLQQIGLLFTSVTNSGFITGLYVILVPVFGLFLGTRTGPGTWIGAVLALVGMLLLSVTENYRVAAGDWLQLLGAACWAVHVLLIGSLARRFDPIRVAFVQFVVCAVISLLIAIAVEDVLWANIVLALPSILYGGLLAVGVGFTLQVVAQKDAITSHAAVILSLEAVFAALFAWLILDEQIGLRGFVGCCLMLAGMLVAQLVPLYLEKRRMVVPVQQEPAGHH